MIDAADDKLNELMNEAQDQKQSADVLAALLKHLAVYTNMDHRDNGHDGDNGAKAENGQNVNNAMDWDGSIEDAISKLPGGDNNPLASSLRGLEFGTTNAKNPNPNFDPNSFICNAAQMSGLQASLAEIQKQNDSDGSMTTFCVQQAVQDRSQQITLLSGIQQEYNKTLDDQVAKI
jgi:hypothetical protein